MSVIDEFDSYKAIQEIRVSDIDGDGDNDIYASSYYSGYYGAFWYEYDPSDIGPKQQISTTQTAWSVLVDLDGDQKDDLLYNEGGIVSWFKNGGNGSFLQRTIISTSSGAQSLSADDIDGDGDFDVSYTVDRGNFIVILWNEGDGTFQTEVHSKGGTFSSSNFHTVADFDVDGDLDILWNYNPGVYFLENVDGYGTFNGSEKTWADYYHLSMRLADSDGDLDPDLVRTGGGSIYVTENINRGDDFVSRIISNPFANSDILDTDDVNQDGHDDIITYQNVLDNRNWNYAQSGENPLYLDYDDYDSYIAGQAHDVNGDGFPDILMYVRNPSSGKYQLLYFENNNATELSAKIERFNPVDQNVSPLSLLYRVTFNVNAENVDIDDFVLSGNGVAEIEEVVPYTTNEYLIKLINLSGSGDVRLNFSPNQDISNSLFTLDFEGVVTNYEYYIINGGVDSGGGGPSTCSDGMKNGDETGIDCGGSCPPCNTIKAPPGWFVSPTQQSHTLLLQASQAPTVDGTEISNGDFIGVFYDSAGTLACGGYVQWNGANTIITAFGNDSQTTEPDGFAANESFQWRIFVTGTEEELSAVPSYEDIAGVFTHQGDFATNGISGLAALSASRSYDLALSSNWSLISAPIQPNTLAIPSLFAPVASSVVIMKDALGGTYFPAFNINTIGNWNYQEGYLIKMVASATLSISGTPVIPESTPLPLSQGWNIVPYLRTSPIAISAGFASLSEVNLVKDLSGNLYWPQFGITTLDSLHPGKGYWMHLLANDTLIYPANSLSARPTDEISPKPEPQHFSPPKPTATSMALAFPTRIAESLFVPGGELAAFDSQERLVGTSVYTGRALGLSLMEDEPDSPEKEGLRIGEPFTLRYWSPITKEETKVEVTEWEGSQSTVYKSQGIQIARSASLVEKISPQPEEILLFPNPSSGTSTLQVSLKKPSQVTISIYTTMGQLVWNGSRHGSQLMEITLPRFEPGTYLVKIATPSKQHVINLRSTP